MAEHEAKQVDKEEEAFEKVFKINRVNKVVKGGKRLCFRAFAICGNRSGSVGIATGKSKEVPIAIKKAIDKAKSAYQTIEVINDTIPHEVRGKFGASKVIIRPAKEGTGVIAGGSVRVVLEALGIKNVVAKSLGSRNPINNARATLEALYKCKNKAEEEKERQVSLSISN